MLLYHAVWLTSWREFSFHFLRILALAFGLVTFTVIAGMHAGQWFISGFEWRVGLVLGVVVAPKDATAESAIAKLKSAGRAGDCLRLRDERRISDELLREIERELDLAEAQLISRNLNAKLCFAIHPR